MFYLDDDDAFTELYEDEIKELFDSTVVTLMEHYQRHLKPLSLPSKEIEEIMAETPEDMLHAELANYTDSQLKFLGIREKFLTDLSVTFTGLRTLKQFVRGEFRPKDEFIRDSYYKVIVNQALIILDALIDEIQKEALVQKPCAIFFTLTSLASLAHYTNYYHLIDARAVELCKGVVAGLQIVKDADYTDINNMASEFLNAIGDIYE